MRNRNIRNVRNTLTLWILINIVLALALVVALVFTLLFAAGDPRSAPPPAAEAELGEELVVDGQALLQYADDFQVSTEYLQLILPQHLVYSDHGSYVFQELDPSLPRHSYDWSRLSYAFGRILYQDENFPEAHYGVDVSYYQGEIDWPAVAADGIDFAFIRAGYRGYVSGALLADENCAANLAGAIAAGLPVGLYVFSQAITEEEAVAEAELALEQAAGYQISYPVAFDMEEIHNETARTDSLSREEATAIALAFCQRIEEAGLRPVIYGNIKFLAGRLDLSQLTGYPLWLAQYYDRPLFPYDFHFWQYSSSGQVAGINGDVDLNICFRLPE